MLDSKTVKILKQWQQLQKENELKFGKAYVYNFKQSDNGKIFAMSKCLSNQAQNADLLRLVCTRSNGHYITPNSLTSAMRKQGTNFHSFRHTHATRLIENMASAKSVAARLGHKNTSITEDLYTHVTKEMQQQTADIIEKMHKNR